MFNIINILLSVRLVNKDNYKYRAVPRRSLRHL